MANSSQSRNVIAWRPALHVAAYGMLEMIFYVVTLAAAAWLLTVVSGT